MESVDKLKPCPFCGSPAELLHTKSWDYFVRCTNKGCAARTRQYHENDVGAVDAWNTRAERTCRDKGGIGTKFPATFICSECGWYSTVFAFGEGEPRYCPQCGREVER